MKLRFYTVEADEKMKSSSRKHYVRRITDGTKLTCQSDSTGGRLQSDQTEVKEWKLEANAKITVNNDVGGSSGVKTSVFTTVLTKKMKRMVTHPKAE